MTETDIQRKNSEGSKEGHTLDMTSAEGSSMGSAHSSTRSPFHRRLPTFCSLRNAPAAKLCDSNSTKQKPRFFFAGLSTIAYTITSVMPDTTLPNSSISSSLSVLQLDLDFVIVIVIVINTIHYFTGII